MIRAEFLRFFHFPQARWAIPVLQELREMVAAATELVAEIGLRFERGDPADELVTRLESRLAVLTRPGVEVPDELRAAIAVLLVRVRETVAAGDEWLVRTGPELATQYARERLRRADGVT